MTPLSSPEFARVLRLLRAATVWLLITGVSLLAQTFTVPLLPGEIPFPAAKMETSTTNWLLMRVRVGNEFDDNALNDNHNKKANSLTMIEPEIGWSFSAPRAQWTFDYRPGFSRAYPVSIYDSRSQFLDTNLHLMPTERLQVHVRENCFQSKNVFDQLQHAEPAPGVSALDRPNDSLFAAAQQRSEQTGADLSYALTRRTVIGASAALYRVSYSSVPEAQLIESATSFGAHAFSSYQLSRHNWIGFDYNVENLVSEASPARSFVQTFVYTETLRLRPAMTVSFFVGPQHLASREGAAPIFQFHGPSQGNWAAGANYVWSNPRTKIILGFSRRISDGAGLEGIVQLTSADVQTLRQFSKRWTGQLSFSESSNTPIVAGMAPFSYVSFSAGLSRALNPKLSIDWQYWHSHGTGFTRPLESSLVDHNRFSASILYNLKVPIPR